MNEPLDSLQAIIKEIRKSTKKTEVFMQILAELIEAEDMELDLNSPLKLLVK